MWVVDNQWYVCGKCEGDTVGKDLNNRDDAPTTVELKNVGIG